ncbi:MAG: DinB family protein [Gemmatimonadales bacterium]|nr:MAG: DinB family protein [Gemmatimonadales bacterium]
MKLFEILKQDAAGMYHATEQLMQMVDTLDWKPSSGSNWMSTAQLLHHCAHSCGMPLNGFVNEGWGVPEGQSVDPGSDGEMVPPLEDVPAVTSVDEALALLSADRELCMEALSGVSDERLLTERSAAPWGGPPRTLFQHCSGMIWHLGQHKGQLFYYLKLQGKDVNTMHLWGM